MCIPSVVSFSACFSRSVTLTHLFIDVILQKFTNLKSLIFMRKMLAIKAEVFFLLKC